MLQSLNSSRFRLLLLHRILRAHRPRRREENHRSRALSLVAFEANRSAAAFNPSQRFGQTEPSAPAGLEAAEKWIERALQRRLVHSAAVVADTHHHARRTRVVGRVNDDL